MRNPFKGSGYPYGSRKRITPEGEPLEGLGVSRSIVKIVVPIIIGIIIIAVIAISSVRMVDAGNRGVLVQFGNVDTDVSLDEGLHFVVPFRDNVVQMEVRTQKVVENAASASKDLQDVSTQVALNYHLKAQQNEAQAIGEQKANIARAEGIKQSNVLQAEGEAQAITIIDQQLRNNPTY